MNKMDESKKNELIENNVSLFLKNPIFILLIIGIIGLSIRLNFFSYDVPITFDALTYFMHATDAKIFEGLPDTAIANNGWPLFLSLFFSLSQSKNFLDYSAIQQLLSISLSVLTIIPVYLLCKKFVKKEYALLGTGIFVLEPRIIQNSLLGITEPLYIILGSIALVFFLSNRIYFIFVSYGFIAITTMVRSEGLFLLIPFSIMFFIKFKNEKKLVLKILLALTIFFLILSPMILYKMDVRDGDDAIFGRVASVLDNSLITSEDTSSENFEHIEKSVIRFFQYIGWIQIPIFIIFVPTGIFLIFRNRNKDSWTIILSIFFMLIPAFYGISTGPDTRYLYFLYPMFCVLATLTIKKFVDRRENYLKSLIIIFGIILGLSLIFLNIQMNDIKYEEDVMQVARYLVNNASGVNNYYPESAFLKPAIIELEKYPMLKKDFDFNKIKKFPVTSNSLIEFIKNNRNEGLSHLVIDQRNDQVEFLKKVSDNEKNYPYLVKEFDSTKLEMKYKVKIFKINYEEFDRRLVYLNSN